MRPASYFAFALVAAAATPARAGIGYNGVQMNGVQMNGVQMNGVQMNGVAVNGLQLSGSWLQGTIIDSNSSCSHSQRTTGAPLNGCSPCAKVVAASDAHCATSTWDQSCVNEAIAWCAVDATQLIGATFTANTNGGTRLLRLDGVDLAPDPAPVWRRYGRVWVDINADVWFYHFSFWQPGYRRPGTWNPICTNANNAAIPVAGQWADCQGLKGYCGGKVANDGFALGCDGIGAIAKCVLQFQYKPWHNVYETTPDGATSHYQTLETFHEACVRMVRGDYCGDGVPHTVDGTAIDVYDHPGVQTQTPLLPVNYHFEGGWTPHGSACISVTRYQSFGGSMTPPQDGLPHYPDAILDCPEVAPIQWGADGKPKIIEGCGNAWDFNPDVNQSLPSGYNDWPRLWYYIGDSSSH